MDNNFVVMQARHITPDLVKCCIFVGKIRQLNTDRYIRAEMNCISLQESWSACCELLDRETVKEFPAVISAILFWSGWCGVVVSCTT